MKHKLHNFKQHSLVLLLLTLFAFAPGLGWGQTTIFTESMGSVSGTTTIAAHETANGFDNDAYTMTNGGATVAADIRTTSASAGYTGASGSANVYFSATSGSYGFAIEGINASAYTSLAIQFGYRKEIGTALPTLQLDYWDGAAYVNVPFTFSQAASATTGWYLSPLINLPAGAQISGLKIRWVKSGTVAVRLDDVKLTGTPSGSTPSITVGSITAFGNQAINTTSSEKTYNVSGTNLTTDLVITPPSGFLISTTSGNGYSSSSIVLSPSSGTVTSTAIYVVFSPTVGQAYTGNITHTSTGATAQNVAVSGTGICPDGAFPFYENFNYTVGSNLSNNCWTTHSGAGSNPIVVTANTLSYPGYLSSGLNNEVSLTASGEDVNRTFTAQTSGVIYASFLVNFSTVSVIGDYFFHLGQTSIGSTFRGRVFVINDGSGNLAFGTAQSTTPVNYTPYSYALNTTYLVVLKFTIGSGLSDDVASIYINPITTERLKKSKGLLPEGFTPML